MNVDMQHELVYEFEMRKEQNKDKKNQTSPKTNLGQ